ncbi:MAG: lipopolysaccharide heptosyltransferase II [Gammaproteobacteria bacterium]|jgi:heptosyltransferase-2|nr:lipopolysaccharide heptosyltransferase II [Gammaproteobacteria bacterium]
MSAPAKTVVVAPAWVGDVVMAQSLLMLASAADRAPVDVIAPPWAPPLLNRMPQVASVHVLRAGHGELGLGTRLRLGRQLRDHAYQRAIIVPRSLKSAIVPWLARIPVRIGFNSELRAALLTEVRHLDKNRLSRTVDRFASLALPADADVVTPPRPQLQTDAANQQRLLATLGLTAAEPVVALMPGAAFGPAKMWPLEHFCALARQLAATGVEIWILGAAGEHPAGEAIAAAAGRRAHNLCGKTRLDDTVDLLALSRAAVSNDSGLMHVAAAAGTYVIGLFGSTPPAMTPPLTELSDVHFLGLDCSPCKARQCPLGHLNCLRQILPEQVCVTVERALARTPA